ncbi:multicopper oxidase domain-containing protein [Bacillus albus]|uniref:multicopper oxidase domain-containing protein n=1 Tax=Bacillus TaxID=1386 RepID=UPI001C100989|nr:multicopper oxidase domain-containing protein [Bacillus albus]MBU5219898.1 multicopper oxidase domain-containing protein [Bacillus albus]
MLREYHVVAIPIRIVINNFGDHDPEGKIYVLKENVSKVKKLVEENPFSTVDLVQPLVIRANVGDTVKVTFENQLPFSTSMHIQLAEYDVQTSDGAFVGNNENTTVPPGEKKVYTWEIIREEIHFFSDLGNPLSSEKGSNVHGLFGALLAQPKGSTWTDPITGLPINSGVYADIHNPLLPSFREFACFFHDEMEVKDLTGAKSIDPHTLQNGETHAINYRAEPMRNRVRLIQEGIVCPDCEGEEVHHDSWVFGDPATPILRAYVGDPLKIRVIHGGVKETHVFHYHVHQWLFERNNVNSMLIDSLSFGPQSTFTVSPLYGAGSLQGAFGDVILHCHLYPHFGEGMWGLNRIFNTLQDGSQFYPNGVPIAALQPLPDRPIPPEPTKDKPGFPNFIPGVFGCKAPRPPLGIEGGRESTELEINQFDPDARPGAVFVNPCPEGTKVERVFNIVGIQVPITYNKEGWNDPEGRIYVLEEEEEAVLSGRKKPEPLVIRANAGECIRINFTNKFPETLGGNAFQLVERTYEAGTHVHFVKFDPLVSDAANVGWNYDSSALRGETIQFQWFADTELKAVFFHDHLFANSHQQHGLFGGICIEPKGSKFLDPRTGKNLPSGTQAIITNPLIPDFRELTLFVHDFSLLFDRRGRPLNPPGFSGSDADPGVMAINYRNEPLSARLVNPDTDPAFVFSSFLHGDPLTPLLQTYNGDPVRIRLFQGAHEESHSFNLHRQSWRKNRPDLESEFTQQQILGISEVFTAEFAIEGDGDFDMLYNYGGIDDIWLGAWGILRTFKERVSHLFPLPDRPQPPKRTKPLPKPTGENPPPATDPGEPCSPNAPVRKFEVVAFQTKIKYNKAGDNDPFGIIFALKEDVENIQSGKINPQPLILRANTGECIEITLHNQLTEPFHNEGELHGYPEVPDEDIIFTPSRRISLHAQMVAYDVLGSDGATVGFNPDQTVAPGESITYRWFIDRNIGSCNLWDMADLRSHRHHGAFGMLITEQVGSVHLDPIKLTPIKTGNQAVISHPLFPDFREFILLMHDGVRLVDKNGKLIIDPEPIFIEPEEELEDPEDQGSRGFNYRSERIIHRLMKNPDVSKVFSSKIHGEPATPIFLAHVNDPVIFRYIFPSDKPRAHVFTLHGHSWLRNENNLNSIFTAVQGENSVGSRANLVIAHGAGGLNGRPGDYMYRSGNIRWDIELGMWGILRVLGKSSNKLPPLQSP